MSVTRTSSTTASLPPPAADALAQSQALLEVLQDEMSLAPGGAISFRRYMDMVLYYPGLGYYVAGSRKFGAEGDFVTAPELGDVFARCLANQVEEVLLACAGDTVLEFGAGSGRLAVDLMKSLAERNSLPERYLILEPSPDLQDRQRRLIEAELPESAARFQWLQGLPEQAIRGCVIANEVLDAMPVVRFRWNEQGLSEQVVRLGEVGFELAYREVPPRLQSTLDDLIKSCSADFPDPYVSEMNPQLDGWFLALADSLESGAALVTDYGYPRQEYYSAERSDGSLNCYYRHHAHADPFVFPGLQDITAHVDFSAVAEAADGAGLDVLGFTSQMAFLVGNGLEAIANDSDPDDVPRHLALSQQIKTLTMPGEMGERFKVMALGRGIDGDLAGFRATDQRWRL